jgi:hypothetical protein
MYNPEIVTGFHSADGSCSYVLIKSLIIESTYTTVLKMDSGTNIQWERTFLGATDRYSMALSNKEDSLSLVLYSEIACPVLKLNTSDGSIINQMQLENVVS